MLKLAKKRVKPQLEPMTIKKVVGYKEKERSQLGEFFNKLPVPDPDTLKPIC